MNKYILGSYIKFKQIGFCVLQTMSGKKAHLSIKQYILGIAAYLRFNLF